MDLDTTPNGVESGEEIADKFLCCVCLELLYKPVVLHFGHISCFWCVHKSMSWWHASRCPICRNIYNHFPSVCRKLHFLLMQLHPITYRQREERISSEERKKGYFSPQFGGQGEYPDDEDRLEPGTIRPADLLCPACKELVFQPVVLNCGDVYCQACIVKLADENEDLKCQICQSTDPRGFPKVCLVLNQFLEENFPRDYALRRDFVLSNQEPKTVTIHSQHVDEGGSADNQSIIHPGIGCDSCGVIPIIGDRYKCRDCPEKAGYDLCGDCYRNRPKLPGRFNQRHTGDHRLDLVNVPPGGVRVIGRLLGDGDASATVVFFRSPPPNGNDTGSDAQPDNASSN